MRYIRPSIQDILGTLPRSEQAELISLLAEAGDGAGDGDSADEAGVAWG